MDKIKSIFDKYPTPPCAKTLGWTLVKQEPETGTVRIRFSAKPEFLNPGGTIQGGILPAMLDDAIGPTIVVKSKGTLLPTTINLNLNFVAPAKLGHLDKIGEIQSLHKSTDFV